MAIVRDEPCPKCQECGHDSRGNHLMVFDDGSKYCGKTRNHKNGLAFYVAPDGNAPELTDLPINGSIKYTPGQFRDLEKTGKLASPAIRELALAGMRGQDRWEVLNEQEKAKQQAVWDQEKSFFGELKIKNLITRHIRGDVAKVFDVRVGHDESGAVSRHYYPVHEQGEWVGAKCRELPKDFKFGHLGRMWGKVDMFGEHTAKSVMDSGERKYKLLLVGGECDAMAAFQMILDSRKGTSHEGKMAHVWSPTKGETALQQIIDRKEHINQFKEIILGFDADETGQKLIKEVSRLFPGKVKQIVYPSGCKDPNDCLKKGESKSFVDSWFNPQECNIGSKVKSVGQLSKRAKIIPEMGLSWVWPSMNEVTLGLRDHMLYLFGAGSGVNTSAA